MWGYTGDSAVSDVQPASLKVEDTRKTFYPYTKKTPNELIDITWICKIIKILTQPTRNPQFSPKK